MALIVNLSNLAGALRMLSYVATLEDVTLNTKGELLSLLSNYVPIYSDDALNKLHFAVTLVQKMDMENFKECFKGDYDVICTLDSKGVYFSNSANATFEVLSGFSATAFLYRIGPTVSAFHGFDFLSENHLSVRDLESFKNTANLKP